MSSKKNLGVAALTTVALLVGTFGVAQASSLSGNFGTQKQSSSLAVSTSSKNSIIIEEAGFATSVSRRTILSGRGVPSKSVGINGDFYLNTKSAILYGPKTKGLWKIGFSKGVRGATGIQGETGEIGQTGARGARGLIGAKGESGLTGASGLVGATGVSGFTGAKGDSGPIGLTGLKGSTGLTGLMGFTGATGAQGAQGAVGATGAQGAVGATGAQGASSQPTKYAAGFVLVSRGNGAPARWASYSTSLGSPYGDTASGSFRFACSAAPCTVSFQAESTSTGVTVYPRVLIYKSEMGTGQIYGQCEYADGSGTTPDGFEPVGLASASLIVNIGGTLDCGAGQIRPADGNVSSITVPTGYYDVLSTFTFKG